MALLGVILHRRHCRHDDRPEAFQAGLFFLTMPISRPSRAA
jgi:hypothetical protein